MSSIQDPFFRRVENPLQSQLLRREQSDASRRYVMNTVQAKSFPSSRVAVIIFDHGGELHFSTPKSISYASEGQYCRGTVERSVVEELASVVTDVHRGPGVDDCSRVRTYQYALERDPESEEEIMYDEEVDEEHGEFVEDVVQEGFRGPESRSYGHVECVVQRGSHGWDIFWLR